jgi:hypothetical protein
MRYLALAVLLLVLIVSNVSAQTDLEALLKDNIDQVVFRSFTVDSLTVIGNTTLVCGKMSFRISSGEYLDGNFVATIMPENDLTRMGVPRSWVTPTNPRLPSNQERYDLNCKK